MTESSVESLRRKKCVPCEGGVPVVPPHEVARLLADLPGWRVSDDGVRIRREWVAKHFLAAMDFFEQVAQLAEQEGHHPDLHLVSYRQVAIELWTHAIGGLSENDFILAAKIDLLPIDGKPA
jgi:4a-hydroxytetrahydrobiopterin dehydratase